MMRITNVKKKNPKAGYPPGYVHTMSFTLASTSSSFLTTPHTHHHINAKKLKKNKSDVDPDDPELGHLFSSVNVAR